MKTFYIRSIISTHVYTYIKENCKIIMNITNKKKRFIERISGVFPHLERRIYTYLVDFCQRTLATIDIPYRARIVNCTCFIESISGVFPTLEQRIYTYLDCFCLFTLATIDIPYRATIMNCTRFIESISAVFHI